MPAFQAINLEPGENEDDQIDTTKELHVDEALKRFQTALKLHAQGHKARDAAASAYKELFDSEIFRYREARTDYERAERQADGRPDVSAVDGFATTLDIDAGGADGVAASLSQALYMSFKNYGQLFLDKLKDKSRFDPTWKNELLRYRSHDANKVLDYWTAALDQDPSDPELWRRTARFASAINSRRIKRYCLEAAVELDDDPTIAEVMPPSLAEGFAGEQLKEHLRALHDEISLSHPIMAPWLAREMPALLKRQLDPIPFLPDPTAALTSLPSSTEAATEHGDNKYAKPVESPEEVVTYTKKAVQTWSELGIELMKCVQDTKGALQICRSILDAASQNTKMSTQAESETASATRCASEFEVATEPQPDPEPKVEEKVKQTVEEPQVVRRSTRHVSRFSTRAKPVEVKEDLPVMSRKESATDADQEINETAITASARKRSQSAAGLADGAEEDTATETRSKRVRRRTETTLAEDTADPNNTISLQLQPYQDCDGNLFRLTKTILENIGVQDISTLGYVQEILESCSTNERPSKLTHQGAKDLRSAITNFSEDVANVLLNKNEQATLGLSSFLEHTKSGTQEQDDIPHFDEKSGLEQFAKEAMDNAQWATGANVASAWVFTMSESYTKSRWSDTTKVAVVQMMNRDDTALYKEITQALMRPEVCRETLLGFSHVLPMLFELHIDVYERITNPSSAVDYATRMETKYRLDRWLQTMSIYLQLLDLPQNHHLCVRFMWAAVLASSLTENPVREHILLLWTSLRDFLAEEDIESIRLPNNAVMPLISTAAADRELSKLTTMDFFLGLFQDEMLDPVEVIDTLEPVLNPASVFVFDQVSVSSDMADHREGKDQGDETTESDDASKATDDDQEADQESQDSASIRDAATNPKPFSENANQGMKDLWKFLLNSSTELRIFLWSRLGDAYEAIGYPTKRFSCLLKSIEMVVNDMERDNYTKALDESRKHLFMRTLKSLDALIIQSLSMALNDHTAFDIIDDDHLKSSSAAVAKICTFLHVSSLCEDESRLGISSLPTGNSTFMALINKLRDMQVRTWCLLFTLFKNGLFQKELLSPENEISGYLAAVHRVFGLRKFCRSSNKIFLKLMRMELLRLRKIEAWEDDLEQVLYDLYGLKLGVGIWEVQDHGCSHEKLEKRQSIQLVEKIMVLANRMTMKDLLKSDLKTTIEHMQQTIGQTKSTAQMIHNLRNLTEMLKKPIHPLRLYQALSGNVSVDCVAVNIPEAALARHGWFFLLGMIALTKFKGVDLNRRQTPGATDDLRIGATFLRLQLQFTADRWDAWFRLAECFDYELDESVLWTADKMNKDRSELIKFQRNAIHCYTLALSHSHYCHEQATASDGNPLHDLYHKFGMRLYSSSREPFAMEPFQHSDQERFFIEDIGAGTFKRILHDQMSPYKVWKFAARLFRMAMEREPRNWKNPYMLTKCYWKMYQTPNDLLDSTDRKSPIRIQTLLEILKKSIEVVHSTRKSKNSDPILEPHYKLVSILHKLVIRGDIPAADAAALLTKQPLGVVVNPNDHFSSFTEPEDWEEYVIRNLVKLREKDKSNWQHRIVMRHAKILFDESNIGNGSDGVVEAKAAFTILKENIFTKTMVMNVWKCDAERPGRHHVFTEQYIRFMTKLLVIMSNRTDLELLLRRLRKKGADFYHFADLWQYSCTAYVKLLRAANNMSVTSDEAFKNMSNEEFEIMSERITKWAGGDGQPNPAFECMKEAIEIKKLNGNLMKVAPIDDLINDCYTTIYKDVAGTLPGLEPGKIIKERNHAKEVAAQLEAVAQAEAKAPKSFSSLLNPPSGGGDSAAGTATPMDTDKAEAIPRAKRLAGVRRPEILRKAEQAVVRALEAPKPVSIKSRVGSMSSTKHGSQTPAIRESHGGSDDEDEEEPDAQMRREAGEDSDEEMRGASDNEEAVEDDTHVEEKDEEEHRESIHDSADDESDLSDVPEGYDDDVPPGLLFPNLGRRVGSGGDEENPDDEEEVEEDEEEIGDEEDEEDEVEAGDGGIGDEEEGQHQNEDVEEYEEDVAEEEIEVCHEEENDDDDEDEEEDEGEVDALGGDDDDDDDEEEEEEEEDQGDTEMADIEEEEHEDEEDGEEVEDDDDEEEEEEDGEEEAEEEEAEEEE